MSDYEDEMDVDAPSSKVVFSSDNTGAKGKRSAANLPVEAEDSLPWCGMAEMKVARLLTSRQGGEV